MGRIESYDLNDLQALLVEKNDYMRHMMRGILFQLGLRNLRESNNPDDAFDVFKDDPVDLVFTDWAPGLDGMHLLTRIRQDVESPDPYVPVIVVTAHTELRHICQARDSGVTEYLAKPVSATLIYGRIRAVIERHRQFIRNADFFGPDRRRRQGEYGGPERRDEAFA